MSAIERNHDSNAGRSGAEPSITDRVSIHLSRNLAPVVALVLLVLAGLPVAVWLDLRSLSEHALRDQADGLISMIDRIRGYYADNVVERVMATGGPAQVLANYHEVPGAIPLPATLSLELGGVISQGSDNIRFRFFSDYPFTNRAPHSFDAFEREALAKLRQNSNARVYEMSGSIFDRRVRLIMPIMMTAGCVTCHNTHPQSPKTDWKIGDVRGIEEFVVRQPITANIFAFKFLLVYFGLVAVVGFAFIGLQRHQSSVIERFNKELGRANAFLASVAQKIAKYLSPQHYRSIFSGQKDVVIATERKKLTIFFSDIVGFTSTTERLQPEVLTALLNEYLTEMSQIAATHGGTVNKFIGDAILIFFGDPETRGEAEDAQACLRMALEMQRRLAQLNIVWRGRGIEQPFRARMGVNTGFVNVGNFGSNDRMDYTIIGAEANLAARLQSIAEPDQIVLGYETYSLVSRMVRARPLEAITLKGIAQPVVPYAVEELEASADEARVISERSKGFEFFLDTRALDRSAAERACRVLEDAVAEMKQRLREG
jgi:adenylate cyclase